MIWIQPWKDWWLLFAHTFTTSFHSQKKKYTVKQKVSFMWSTCANPVPEWSNNHRQHRYRQWDFLQHATLKVTPIFVNYSGVNIVFIFGMCNLLCVVFFLYISLFFRKKEKRKQAHPWGLVLLPQVAISRATFIPIGGWKRYLLFLLTVINKESEKNKESQCGT